MQAGDDFLGSGGIVELHVDHADFAGVGGELLQGSEGNHQAGQHAGFIDAANTPWTIQNRQRIPQMKFVFGSIIAVHHYVAGLLKRTALFEPESAVELVELRQIHAGDVAEQVSAVQENSGGRGDMRLFVYDHRNELSWHADTERNHGTTWRADYDIGPHTFRSPGLLIQHARAQAHQSEDHGDLNADGDHAEQRSDRPMLQVLDNQFIDQATCRIRLRAAARATAHAFRCAQSRCCETSDRTPRTCRRRRAPWCPASSC